MTLDICDERFSGRKLAAYLKRREEKKYETADRLKKAAHVGGIGVLRQGT